MKLLALALVFLAVAMAYADPPTITLPPDAEVVTIVGNGFRLNVTQLANIKSDWQALSEDIEKEKQKEREVEDESTTNSGSQNDKPQEEENKSNEDESSKANDASAEDAAPDSGDSEGEKDYGYLDADLHTWIEDRASALSDRVERYSEEIVNLKQGQRVVSQVLLLNTLNDLDTLTNENIKSLKWIKNKLRWIMNVRSGVTNEVNEWVSRRISESLKIEPTVRGKNDPGSKWLTNVQAIKRIVHEQRFSDDIKKSIVDFLGGEFNMMTRNRVFDINKPAQILNDGLYYYQAKGRIPAYFPFFSQDSIINGSQL